MIRWLHVLICWVKGHDWRKQFKFTPGLCHYWNECRWCGKRR